MWFLKGVGRWWGSGESVAREGEEDLGYTFIYFLACWEGISLFQKEISLLPLSLLFCAKQEGSKTKVSSCLQSVLRFVGENHSNPSSTHNEM